MIEEGKTLFANGFNEAIIGTTQDGRVVYSKVLMTEELVVKGMSVEEAFEYLEFNTWNTYVGEFTPVYVDDFDSDAEEIKQYLNA